MIQWAAIFNGHFYQTGDILLNSTTAKRSRQKRYGQWYYQYRRFDISWYLSITAFIRYWNKLLVIVAVLALYIDVWQRVMQRSFIWYETVFAKPAYTGDRCGKIMLAQQFYISQDVATSAPVKHADIICADSTHLFLIFPFTNWNREGLVCILDETSCPKI